jgi:type I restriction enzyme M protein
VEEVEMLEVYLKHSERIGEINKQLKDLQKSIEKKVWDKYKTLSDNDIKLLVVDHKWINHLENAVQNEMQRISQRLTQRIKELVERYEIPIPLQLHDVKSLEEKVNAHLTKMGFVWK